MITVIIPMYNTENYIDRCLESVTGQSYLDLEIIVINDGSTDGSADKVRAFAQKDQRIRLIEQENHGLVYSRKVGVNKALGEYVLFVDSDDYLEVDMIEKMVAMADGNQADVVASGAIFEAEGRSVYRKIVKNIAEAKLYAETEAKELKEKLFCAADFCTMALLPFLWNKLWKKELINDYVLGADDRFTVGEDVAIGFPAIMAADRILVSDYTGYHYCQRKSSMMRSDADDAHEYVNACRIYRYLFEQGEKRNWSEKCKDDLQRFLVNQLLTRCYGKTNSDLKSKGLAGFTEEMPDRLVIYGAGELGKAIYNFASSKTKVEAWIDRDAKYLRVLGYEVDLPDETVIPEDCPVIVAVFDEKAVSGITSYLISRGIDQERIFSFDRKVIRHEPVKNVIIWGTFTRTAMYYGWLKSNYNIVAFIDEAGSEGSFDQIPVIGRERIGEYKFDGIIVTNEDSKIEKALKSIKEVDAALLPRVIDINQAALGNERIENYFDQVAKIQLEIIDEILSATDEEVSDFDWMYQRVIRYGVFCFGSGWMKQSAKINWAVIGLQQVPEEFAQFCCHISGLKVSSAMEIGVYRGRSAFFLCAVLARRNKDMTYKLVDLCDRIDDFDKFKAKLPQLVKCIPSSSEDHKGESYDFVFIDADHSYDAVMEDYKNVGIHAGVITAFHDIYAHEYDGENGGTVRAWNEVLAETEDHSHKVFSRYPDKWMGIGAVIWNRDYYVFGAHSRGQTMRTYMKTLFPEQNFLGYLYDDAEENPEEIDGERVVCLEGNQSALLETEARVYIATRGVYHAAIKEKLLKLGFTDIVPVDVALDRRLRNSFVAEYYKSHGWEYDTIESLEAGVQHPSENQIVPGPAMGADIFVIKSAFDKPLAEEVPLREYERIIQAGTSLAENRLDNCAFFDNGGDNISGRNRQMCELTAMYWVWKNHTGKIVGSEHYRRRFILPGNWQNAMECGDVDVILPVPLYVHPTLKENYCQRHTTSTWEAMEQALFEIHPDCADDAVSFFETTSCYSPCNMVIARKAVYDELCQWLFPVLFAVNERCGNIDDNYQNRYPGFLSERLITYFFRMKSEEYKIVYSDKSFLN